MKFVDAPDSINASPEGGKHDAILKNMCHCADCAAWRADKAAVDNKISMLEEAAAQVKQRRAVYGSPKPNFDRIADFWNVYWAHRMKSAQKAGEYVSFNAIDVATMMRFVKEARLIETPDHRDSLVDIAGYADCHIECTLPD